MKWLSQLTFFGSTQVEWKLYDGFYLACPRTFSPLWNVSRGWKRGCWIKIQHSTTRITRERPSGKIWRKKNMSKRSKPKSWSPVSEKKVFSKKCSTKPPAKEIKKKSTYNIKKAKHQFDCRWISNHDTVPGSVASSTTNPGTCGTQYFEKLSRIPFGN